MKKTNKADKKEHSNSFEFKIIAGTFKNRTIKAPNLGITRPPLTRLRKSIFDFLKPYLHEAHYLDLFSGTGSYLFEAVSRGVVSATGVELEKQLVDSINKQADRFSVGGRLICLCDNVFKAVPKLKKQQKKFDIIMIAPPQYKGIIDKTLLILREYPIVTDEHLILCQHDTSETKDINFDGFEILQQRKYGNTTFTVMQLG